MTSNPKMTEVRCAQVAPPGGHYAQAQLHGNTLYVSGQLGLGPGMSIETSVAEQVAFALENVERIARVVGAARGDIVRCTLYLDGVEHGDEANRAYAAFFGTHRPARSVVPCATLHHGCKVEIEAIVAVTG